MTTYIVEITLRSDATFGRGDGIAGLIDLEVEHDQYGLPYLRGRTLKGLLSEECDNLIAVAPTPAPLKALRDRLFGVGGSDLTSTGLLHLGDARLPSSVRQAVLRARLPPEDILRSMTTIRYQTAMDAASGVAREHSLRAIRAIVRGTIFYSEVVASRGLEPAEQALLVAGCRALRRIGVGRNRGRGAVQCRMLDSTGVDLTEPGLRLFAEALQ